MIHFTYPYTNDVSEVSKINLNKQIIISFINQSCSITSDALIKSF